MNKIDEDQYLAINHGFDESIDPKAIVYRGMGNYFHDIEGHNELIRNWLLDNATFEGSVDTDYDIGIHVRLGDFLPSGSDSDHHSVRQPLEWYENAYRRIVNKYDLKNPRTLLFTDEKYDDVKNQLSTIDLQPDPGINAITSIMNLSRAKYIITSRSTFSMWAVYLNQSHAIWNDSLNLEKSMPVRDGKDIIYP